MFRNKSKADLTDSENPSHVHDRIYVYDPEKPIFTAEEAYECSLKGSRDYKQEVLGEASRKIMEATKIGDTCCFLETYSKKATILYEELPKYGYVVEPPQDGSLFVSWDKAKVNNVNTNVSDINPYKSYILPMPETETWKGKHLYAYLIKDQWCTGWAPSDDYAISCGNTVKGSDILNAPDWIKAIKPVGVKE